MKHTLVLLVSLLVFVFSCSKKEGDSIQPLQELTVQQAHQWFDAHSTFGRDGGRRKGSKFDDFSPDWTKAKAKVDEKNRKYVQVPLKHKNKYVRVFYLKRGETTYPVEIESTFYSTIIYSDGSGLTDIVKEDVPDEEYVYRNGSVINPTDFTGRVLLWSWEGEVTGGMVYKEGRAIRGIFPASKSGRQIPITTTFCDWNRGCKNGGFGDLTIYSTTTSSSGAFGDCSYPSDAYSGSDDYYCSAWERVATHSYTEWIEVPDETTPGSGPGTGTDPADIIVPNIVINDMFGDIVDPVVELKCFNFSTGAKLTIYVDQPTANTRAKISANDFVGHSFIGIEQGGVTRYIGFYPEKKENVVDFDYRGEIHDDSQRTYDVSISKDVTPVQLNAIIYYASNHPGWYSLNRYNCTDFALDIAELGGMTLPRTTSSQPVFKGRSPGDLGQDIRERSLQNGESRNTTTANAPQKNGTCN